MTEQLAAVDTPAPSELDEMGALFDKLTADGITEEETPIAKEEPTDGLQQEEKAEGLTEENAEPAPEPEKPAEPAPEAPTDLPPALRAKWANMPEEARDAVLSSHRDLARRLADQGRVVQASKPVFDVLVQAAKEIPTLADMTPQQIAAENLDRGAKIRLSGDRAGAGQCQMFPGPGLFVLVIDERVQ